MHFSEAAASGKSRLAYRGQGNRNDQVAREAAATIESTPSYRGHRIGNDQTACQTAAIFESRLAYRGHGTRQDDGYKPATILESIIINSSFASTK